MGLAAVRLGAPGGPVAGHTPELPYHVPPMPGGEFSPLTQSAVSASG